MPDVDLRSAADRMTRLLENVDDSALDAPTPCPDYRLRQLIDHVGGFAMAFTATAKKDLGEMTSQQAGTTSTDLEPGWRARISADLATLADAWESPQAWTGMTRAGGVDLPGEVAGRVVLDELVVHGWDVARATGQPFEVDDESLRQVEAMVHQFRDGNEGEVPGLFGPVTPVADDASLLSKVVALTGRSPDWSPR